MSDRTYYLVIADVIIRDCRLSAIEDIHDLLAERQVVDLVARTENVRRIVEVNPEENSSRDISEDIALALANSPDDLNENVRDFLEEQLGCDLARVALEAIAA
ncbi:MAG TPA: hypothetical protein VHY56_13250 [Candidatus Binataceae bacterium]|jgi:hypothetical protein|nr:hypothetical protein [Candidatus Binataceae bacterium]